MPSLIDSATALIELLDQYDCDQHLAAAKSQLNAAVVAELLTYGTHVTIPRGGRPPTIDDLRRSEAVDRLRQGWTYAQIAFVLGISEGEVCKIAKRAGIVRPRGRRKAQ